MIEYGHLGDHPAHADPREARGPLAERAAKDRRIGGEIAQGGLVDVDGGHRVTT